MKTVPHWHGKNRKTWQGSQEYQCSYKGIKWHHQDQLVMQIIQWLKNWWTSAALQFQTVERGRHWLRSNLSAAVTINIFCLSKWEVKISTNNKISPHLPSISRISKHWEVSISDPKTVRYTMKYSISSLPKQNSRSFNYLTWRSFG